jgi:hypothetical protein
VLDAHVGPGDLGVGLSQPGRPSMMGVEGWSCDSMNSIHCCNPSMNVTGSVTMWLRSFAIEPSNNCKGWGVARRGRCGVVCEFCTCTVSMKFSEAPQSTSADTGVSERRGMETVMMNDDGESNEMVVHRCAASSDKETSAPWSVI